MANRDFSRALKVPGLLGLWEELEDLPDNRMYTWYGRQLEFETEVETDLQLVRC